MEGPWRSLGKKIEEGGMGNEPDMQNHVHSVNSAQTVDNVILFPHFFFSTLLPFLSHSLPPLFHKIRWD